MLVFEQCIPGFPDARPARGVIRRIEFEQAQQVDAARTAPPDASRADETSVDDALHPKP